MNDVVGIQEKIKSLTKKIQEAQKDNVIRIGLLGIPDSGKSSLLAIWSLFPNTRSPRTMSSGDATYALTIVPQGETAVYFRQLEADLLKDGKLDTTAAFKPKQLTFQVDFRLWNDKKSQRRTTYQFETRDFAGAFVLPGATPEFQKELNQHYHGCDVILCLIDATLTRTSGCRDQIAAIAKSLPAGVTGLGIVLTKFDLMTANLPRNNEAFAEEYRRLIGELPALIDIQAQVQAKHPHQGFSIIPISSFGYDIPKNQPIRQDELQPWNHFEPLVFAIYQKRLKLAYLRQQRDACFELLKQVAGITRESFERLKCDVGMQIETNLVWPFRVTKRDWVHQLVELEAAAKSANDKMLADEIVRLRNRIHDSALSLYLKTALATSAAIIFAVVYFVSGLLGK